MQELYDRIQSMDEEYLIGIANRGIVKRAQKELPELSIKMEETEEGMKVFWDEIVCTYRLPVENFTCTCPSRSVCKHKIIGLLYLKEHWKKEEQSKSGTPQWNSIESYPRDRLYRVLGANRYMELLSQWQQGMRPEIQEGSVITVKLETETVKLVEPLESSVCTCHRKEMCPHKAEAILAVQLSHGVFTVEEGIEEYWRRNETAFRRMKETAVRIQEKLEDLMRIGLSRLPETGTDSFYQLALLAHNSNLPEMERELRTVGEECRRYAARNSHFDRKLMIRRICRLYEKAARIEEEENGVRLAKLAGAFRVSYKEQGELRLFCAGVKAFRTKSGYEGSRVYLYALSDGQWYTFTRAKPSFYEKGNYRNEEAPWGLPGSLEGLVGKEIILQRPRVSPDHRLSSSTMTQGELVKGREVAEYPEMDYYTSFPRALLALRQGRHFAFVQGYSSRELPYDAIGQRYQRILMDRDGKELMLEVEYNDLNQKTIGILENIEKKGGLPIFFGELYLSGGRLRMMPIEVYDGTLKETEAQKETDAGSVQELRKLLTLGEELEQQLVMLIQSGFESMGSMDALRTLSGEYVRYGLEYGSQLIARLASALEAERGSLNKSWKSGMKAYVRCVKYQTMFMEETEWKQAEEAMK